MKKFALMAVLAAAVGFAGEKTVLWKGGDGGIAVYRIPALCTAPNGDLVAVCDARRDNGGDLNAFQPINIVCRRSSDGGKTWTPSTPTWTWPWMDADKWSGSDPSLIVDAQAKKIFLLYNVWHWKNPDGSDRFGNVYRFHVQESSDNGKTWSKPRDITDDISFPEWPFGKAHNAGGFIFISSGSGIQTKDGTLLHTLVHVNDGNALFGSPDHGKTWRAYGKPVKQGDECKVVELKDGSWMINSRWRGGGRQIHVSKDRGETWASRYDTALEDPQCNAQIMRYGDKLLFTNCKSPTRRALLHLRVSADDGATWSDGLCVEPQGAAYSDMTILPNGDVGVIYEGAGYNTIVFTTVPAPRAAAARKVRIACIGDSITYGLGLADREKESYPAQLQKAFDERFPGKCEVRNFGNSGRGIYLDSMRGRERRGFRWMPEHKAALAWKPDVVVCNLGINDCGEYIKEYTGGRRRGQFRDDYLALLGDYRKAVPRAKLFIWTKLSPLAEGQRFHRSPEPFLMQRDLEDVARRAGAVGIDMQEPLREEMDEIFARDKIHPSAEGARIIAARTSAAIVPAGTPCGLMPDVDGPAKLPSEVAKVPHEVWLCAGQSNMQKGWGEFNATPAEQARVASEMARLAKCNIHFWDFNDGRWSKLTPENALRKSAFGVSFAIRRAEKTGKAIGILYVAAGGAPTEAFLSEATMCAVGGDGKPLYPHLAAIATNRRRLDRNEDFPCTWVAREYPRRRGNSEEARWWPVARMYDHGIRRIKDGGIKVDGILWYQGESNATACTTPDGPTPSDYQLETLRAVVCELRAVNHGPQATNHEPRATFLMMGLPKMNRPWEPYRAAQRQVCAETGAIYVDAFGAGLGDERDVHPRDKVPFAELAVGALENSKRTAVSLVSGGVSAEGVKCGRVALHTWLTSAEFKDISVTAADGRTLWKGLPDPAKCGAKAGQWEVADGVLRQKDVSARDTALVFGEESWTDYTFKAKARTLAGKEGFIVHVRERSPGQCIYANYGGWMNTAHAIETKGAYDFATPRRLDAAAFKPIETGRWYDLEVSVVGDKVTMKLDGANLFAGQDVPEVVFDARENKVVVDPSKARFPVSEDMWGIFFEDIDFSLDGGVYAELVRNRSFEDGQVECRKQKTIGYWSTVGHATVALDTSKPISEKNRNCGRVEALPGGGVANDGYFGIAVKDGAKYRLSVALRGDVRGRVDVALQSLGKTFAAGSIDGVGPEWKTFGLTLEAKGTDPDAKLVFTAPRGGTFYLDCVSLFPCDTYGTSGLFRKDLMERLAALKPSFVRFPGGCWVEGNTMAEAYRWKQTIGNVWDRRTQWNLWGYWSANGVGFHEYLVLCEELGAKALFCINCGMSHKETVPLDKMDEFVQDALDCIEYANGPVTSKWGAARAANGHPAPFNLLYLEIGNENGGEKYYERYALIHDAVRAKYPEIKIVSDVWHGTVKGRPQHIRDEHYYRSPDWFMSAGAKLYDDYPRGEFEVFVGEYAVTRDVGRWGDLRAAIGEAAFMCGLERNADVVKLAAYAPLFANAKHTAWTPNLIYPMTDGNFVNPSWNVQKLFSENRGRKVLAFSQESRWMKTKDGKACRAVAVSAVRDADGSVVVKAVNCSEEPQPFTLALAGTKVSRAGKTWFTGPDAHASNSPLVREALKESSGDAKVVGGAVVETLPPLSLTVFHVR